MSRAGAALRLALRLERPGLVAAALLMTAVALGTAASFPSVMGTTPEERLAAAGQAEELAAWVGLLLPRPVRVETLGGYVQWRVFGGLPILAAAWALLAGSAAVRGEEERGRLEQWLAGGLSRHGWVAARGASFATAGALAVTLSSGAAAAGALLAGGRLPAGPLAGMAVALWGLLLVCDGVTLVAAQFAATRRSAVALAGAVLAALYLLNSVPRAAGETPPSRWLSPFFWYERSDALVPGGRFDPPSALGLIAAATALTALAGALLARRDLGAPLIRLRIRTRPGGRVVRPSANPAWRAIWTADLYEQRTALVVWVGAAAALPQILTAMARPIVEVLLTSPATRASDRILGSGDPHRALLGYFLFGTLQLLIALYVTDQTGRWAAAEGDGRLATQLTAPVARWRVVVERTVALAVAMAAIAAVGTVSGLVGARDQGIRLGAGEAADAAIALLPFGLSLGGLGAALVGVRPRAAMPVLGTFSAASFLLLELGTVFGWPSWLVNLSVFGVSGTPLVEGISWPHLGAVTAVGLAGFVAATAGVERRDIDG